MSELARRTVIQVRIQDDCDQGPPVGDFEPALLGDPGPVGQDLSSVWGHHFLVQLILGSITGEI